MSGSKKKAHAPGRKVESPSDVGSMESTREVLFANLERAADVLVQTFGKHCEVAIHDFRDTGHSLVHIAGRLTGRKPGAPITNLAVLKDWRSKGNEVKDLINYQTSGGNDRLLKSSTCYIRDGEGTVIGAMGINIDLTALKAVESALGEFTRVEAPDEAHRSSPIPALAGSNEIVLEAALGAFDKSPSAMSRSEKRAFVEQLERDGAFLVKGMVNSVAASLNVSIYTVYNYLRQIRQSADKGLSVYESSEE